MPIYEYACRPCGKIFEELIVRKADEDEVSCPSCRSTDIGRVISRPAAAPASRSPGGGPPPSCGPVG